MRTTVVLLEKINGFLSGAVLPVVLLLCGLFFIVSVRAFFALHPIRFAKSLKEAAVGGGTSPFKALSLALAGTLGVGNIAGVATAIVAGGAGAVFWMWMSALIAMSVKYAEVVLAVHFRRHDDNRFHGGAMYYIRDGAPHGGLNTKIAVSCAYVFAALCLANALLPGNIVQVNSAAAASGNIPSIAVGAVFAVLMLIISFGGAKRISSFTVALIPFLSAVYILLSTSMNLTPLSISYK